ncbi:hypothetical protein [Nocardia terpenica]|nr:hypothetical protein [Nocardia terpenica]
MSDYALWLTPEETIALREELREVLARYRQESPETAADTPEGAERVNLVMHILPELDVRADSEARTGPRKASEPMGEGD